MSSIKSSLGKEVVRLPIVPPAREKISYSEWQLFRSNCQWRWYLEYVKKLKMGDRSIALEFGTAIGTTLEQYLNPDVSKRISIDDAVLLFHAKMDLAVESLTEAKYIAYGPWPLDTNGEPQQGDSPEYLKMAGERILRAIGSVSELTDCRVVSMEHEIDDVLQRSDSPIRYRGFIDILIALKDKRGKMIFIVGDFKTCKWGWPYDKQRDANVLAQVRLYKHFLCKKLNVDPKLVRTVFFLLKKAPRKNDSTIVESLQVPSSERDITMTLNSLQTDVTKMRSGVYEKNFDSCSKPWGQCPYLGTEHCSGPNSTGPSDK